MGNHPGPTALRISLVYAFLAGLWFLLSDYLLERVVMDTRLLVNLESAKGILFVLATALLSYVIMVRELRRWRRAEDRLREVEGLQHVSLTLLQQHTLEDVLGIVCREIEQVSGAPSARIVLLEDQATRPRRGVAGGGPLARASSIADSWLTLPLSRGGLTLGILQVAKKPGGFSANERHLLSLLADQTALAIANARAHEQAKQGAVLEERNRLARELHDSVTQALYSTVLYADATRLALAAGKEGVALENLQELRQMARQAMADMRLLLFELHPPQLESEGLVAALQERLNAVEARAGLHIDFQAEGESRLSPAVETELYQISQEALNNVVKHAHAEKVIVDLRFSDQHGSLTIQDDGVGMDPATLEHSGGVGLRSITERAARIGGTASIESAPGQGTKVHIEV